jgi:hypothetical protein
VSDLTPVDRPPGPLDGWEECGVPGCPSTDDNATDADIDAFEESDGWAHGVKHFHHIDHYIVPTTERT